MKFVFCSQTNALSELTEIIMYYMHMHTDIYLNTGLVRGGFCLGGFALGFLSGRFCLGWLLSVPLLSEYSHYNRKLNITFNFRFHMYEFLLKSVTSHALGPLPRGATKGGLE